MTSSKPRILVVDDNEATRYSLARALRAEGHEIVEAASGAQTLELAHSALPDVIVLDVRLPDILGFEVAERLRADEATRAIAILQISASFTAADAQAQGLRRGADAYLTHPVDPQVLTATVQALLRMRRAEQVAQRERARAEANEERYRFLADMLPQLVWSSDGAGRPDYFNRRWYEFTGTTAEEMRNRDWADFVHPEDRPRFAEAWSRSLRTGEPLDLECRRWSPAVRDFRWMLVRGFPMRGPDGAISRWFGTSTDIQGQKEALAERERLLAEARDMGAQRDRLVEQLREESRRKNDFLAILSHELRNPLAPIRNSVYVLERALPGGEQARRAREVIDRQVQHMTRLVDDLLDVTRIARGKIRLQREQVELNGLVRRSAEDHRDLLRRGGVELEVKTWNGPLPVDGDPTRLAQVVGNLLQNAAKFTPPGGKVTVSLSLDAANVAVLRVRDTGAGITDETLDRSSGGLGLGLALAKGIVELHGGSIAARSEGAGKGAEFTIRLPLEKAASPKLTVIAGAAATGGPRRILIIEDLRDAAESLREALELSNHVVEIASDGPQGLAVARTFAPDVVLCDIGLPLMDGYEVARQVRQDPKLKGVFLVALSGYALQEDVERAKEAGFDQHMAKPPRLDDLERLLALAPARGPVSVAEG